ncbi:MAG: hypothetical protein O7A71_00040 [Chloroflexi bacterium]|nr:hypothetical protein [Chloroflexota bacterium]
MTRMFLYAYCRALQLREEEEGLTILAYALGAAAVVVPLAILMIGFGDGAVQKAADGLNSPVP